MCLQQVKPVALVAKAVLQVVVQVVQPVVQVQPVVLLLVLLLVLLVLLLACLWLPWRLSGLPPPPELQRLPATILIAPLALLLVLLALVKVGFCIVLALYDMKSPFGDFSFVVSYVTPQAIALDDLP